MVLLINPKTTKNSQNFDFYFREPNLGILYLAALLDSHNYDVEILDLEQFIYSENFDLEKIVLDHIRYHKVIGITSLTNTYSFAHEIIKIIKSYNSDLITILGGPHVSFFYEDLLNKSSESRNLIDFICIGESERSFISLIHFLKKINYNKKKVNKNQSKLELIKGLAYPSNTTNGFIFTGYDNEPIDIEELPHPARNYLTHTNYYYNVANVIINRGCPNRCSFCSRQNLFRKTRIRSIESIFSELEDIYSLNTYKYINFYDNININKEFFKQFCLKFIQWNEHVRNPIPWGCELRADSITREEAKLLKKSGCMLIATGIESASEEVLKQNFKYQDPKKVKEGIVNLKSEGLPIQAYFVLGLPGETEETFNRTINFIKELPFTENDKINYFIATPYPGSRLWIEKKTFGLQIFEKNFDKYDCEHLIFETKDLSKDKLKEMIKQTKEIENYFS
ncbi:MAG: radical SAM protein [Candidatus Lokiarchaeota archaeon]